MTDKFKQAFLEEAREILVELESALLELNENRSDREIVGRAFRALHTIKGSGSMFGFDLLAGFVHNLENAFDEVRNGRLTVTPELVNLSLAALDQIKAMLEEAAGRGEVSSSVSETIVGKLLELTGKAHARPAEATASASPLAAIEPVKGTMRDWEVHFHPAADLMSNGADPLLLVRELRQLGSLQVKANMAAVPPIAELDPARCYVAWDMVLTTAAEREAIADVFIFVADCCELTIGLMTIKPMGASMDKSKDESIANSMSEPEGRASAATAMDTSAPTIEPNINPNIEPVVVPSIEPEAKPELTKQIATASGRTPEMVADPGQASNPAPAAAKEATSKPWGRRQSDTPDNATSIRVPAAKLDQFVDLVGELVTVQARLFDIAVRREDPEVVAVSEEIERLTTVLREKSIGIRMLPIRATFERFRRLVHDLARDLHKEVELTTEGAETELDKSVLDQLNDPLMHLIRNSMDHGIEAAEKRRAAGKRPGATIHLSARHSGASVLICIDDDGGGIDAAAVRERAVEKGMVAADAQLSESQIFSLILAPGFSTARQITDVSGRGVGMDVVRRSVEMLRGRIDIASKPGAGTTVTLRLPLTLAIIDGLLVRVERAYFVLPLATTLECIELTRQDIEKANGKHVANVRGEIIPYIRLREYFNMPEKRPEREQIMVAETEEGRFGFVVDQVLGDHQTVIKSLGRFYQHVEMVSGATILGNGTVALILDPQRLVRDALRTMAVRPRANAQEKSMVATEEAGGAMVACS
jgi:two-component system chemotaxis sensor kinase CheA